MNLLVAAALAAFAQENGDDLQGRRDRKLASEFLKKQGWILEYEKALEVSAQSGRPVFAYFSRSYTA
jgi:hypothetical protein